MPSFYQDRLGTNIGKTHVQTVFSGSSTVSVCVSISVLQFCVLRFPFCVSTSASIAWRWLYPDCFVVHTPVPFLLGPPCQRLHAISNVGFRCVH
jgi:hypothetical protein